MSTPRNQFAELRDSPRVRFARRIAADDQALRLYAILDGESCRRRNLDLLGVAQAWRDAGVQLMQYRDKNADKETVLANARSLRSLFSPEKAFLILNDRADLVQACGFDGAHIGQGDGSIKDARETLGADGILGISTHSADQALAADAAEADYVAIGPVFATATKADAEPAVGLCGVQAARAVTTKPLVAIGGITLDTALAVRHSGARAVAVISALLPADGSATAQGRAQDFLARLQ